MRAIAFSLYFSALLVVAGCAAHPDPIIDTKGENPDTLAQDWGECDAISEQAQIEKGVARGAGLGAAIGAAAGAIGGNSDDVAEGAGFGALYGGTDSGLDAAREKQDVFKRCMAGRGYRVLN